jgi:hypothetical protein
MALHPRLGAVSLAGMLVVAGGASEVQIAGLKGFELFMHESMMPFVLVKATYETEFIPP